MNLNHLDQTLTDTNPMFLPRLAYILSVLFVGKPRFTKRQTLTDASSRYISGTVPALVSCGKWSTTFPNLFSLMSFRSRPYLQILPRFSSNPSYLMGKRLLSGRSWPQLQFRNEAPRGSPGGLFQSFRERDRENVFQSNVLIRGVGDLRIHSTDTKWCRLDIK